MKNMYTTDKSQLYKQAYLPSMLITNYSPPWFDSIIESFNHIDQKGTAFRFGITIPKDELYIDLKHMKQLMSWLQVAFQTIKDEIEDS